jgi:hypothetical protein
MYCVVCKEMPVNKVVDKKRIIGKMRAKEEETPKGSLTPKSNVLFYSI